MTRENAVEGDKQVTGNVNFTKPKNSFNIISPSLCNRIWQTGQNILVAN